MESGEQKHTSARAEDGALQEKIGWSVASVHADPAMAIHPWHHALTVYQMQTPLTIRRERQRERERERKREARPDRRGVGGLSTSLRRCSQAGELQEPRTRPPTDVCLSVGKRLSLGTATLSLLSGTTMSNTTRMELSTSGFRIIFGYV